MSKIAIFSLSGLGFAGREGAAAPLLRVCQARVAGVAHCSSEREAFTTCNQQSPAQSRCE